MLFQGFDAPAIVSQKRPEIPKAKKDEQPIPVAIIEVEDKDLLNFMSGGLTVQRSNSILFNWLHTTRPRILGARAYSSRLFCFILTRQ